MKTRVILFTGRLLLALFVVLLALCFASCTSVSRTDPTTGITTKATIALTKAAYITVDGPVPTVQGYLPVTDKQGRTTGYTPVLGAPSGGPVALFAAYGLDQVEGAKEVRKMITASVASVITGQVLKHMDNNKTASDQAKIAADSKASSEATKLATTKENNKHALSMAELEVTE